MAKIRVNTELMKKTQMSFEEEIQKLKQAINEIVTTVEETNLIWEGPMHNYFVKLFKGHKEQLSEIIEELRKYEEALSDTRTKYEKSDREVAGYVRKL